MDRVVDLRDFEPFPGLLMRAVGDSIDDFAIRYARLPEALLLTREQVMYLVREYDLPEPEEMTGSLFGIPFEVLDDFPYLLGGPGHGYPVPERFRESGEPFHVAGPAAIRRRERPAPDGDYFVDYWEDHRYVRTGVSVFGEILYVWHDQDLLMPDVLRLLGRELGRGAQRLTPPEA